MDRKRLLGACATVALLSYLGPTAIAPAKEKSPALEEIVVTAQKRRENLQTVPITVTAVSAAALVTNRVETTQDLQLMGRPARSV
jgi:iron complex outermembrane receptor protein